MSPFTSLYVPTTRETETVDVANIGDLRDERRRRWKPWWHGASSNDELALAAAVADDSADNKEGGTGTRAKGEEGSMGNPNARDTGHRYGVQGPGADPSRQAAMQEAAQFGMIGLICRRRRRPLLRAPTSSRRRATGMPAPSAMPSAARRRTTTALRSI